MALNFRAYGLRVERGYISSRMENQMEKKMAFPKIRGPCKADVRGYGGYMGFRD